MEVDPSLRCFLVIPHFRDTDRLRPYLSDLQRELPESAVIQVVDDGSGPDAFGQLEALLQEAMARRAGTGRGPRILPALALPVNQGKGAAVLAGWRTSASEPLLAFVDADGAVSAGELCRALECMRLECEAASVLIGSRIMMAGRRVERRMIRHIGGRVFATAVSMLAGLQIYDTQCGLKILRRDAYESIAPRMRTAGFSFDVELLMHARQLGFSIREFPVDWNDVSGGKVSLVRHSLPMLWEVVRARWRLGAPGGRMEERFEEEHDAGRIGQ